MKPNGVSAKLTVAHGPRRLKAIETELEIEPRRIADTYRVRAIRVDPIGLVYLWPRTG